MENETHVILISGRYVTHKFDTSSSCLTYKFKQDNLGFKSIEQQRQLPLVGTVGLDHEYMWVSQDWRWDRSGSQSQPFETGNDTIDSPAQNHKTWTFAATRAICTLRRSRLQPRWSSGFPSVSLINIVTRKYLNEDRWGRLIIWFDPISLIIKLYCSSKTAQWT